MIEYIVITLIKKFKVDIDMAIYFYYELLNRRKLEHFINHIDEYKTFEEIKNFYLGGQVDEL